MICVYKINKIWEGVRKEEVLGRVGDLYLLFFVIGILYMLFRIYKCGSSLKWLFLGLGWEIFYCLFFCMY